MGALEAFGKPKYKQQYGKMWGLQEGEQIYRLLPPFKSCAETGEWAVWMSQHFGYSGQDPDDEKKTRQRPFKCIQVMDFRTKMVTKSCPACDAIAANKEAWALAEAKAKEEGKDKDEIKTICGDWISWAKVHNRDGKFYMNAINGAGELGTLKITGKCFKALKEEIKKIQDEEGFDPLDPEQGIYFTFKRIGKGIDTQDSVKPCYEDVKTDGKKYKQLKTFALTEELAQKAIDELPDLHSLGTDVPEEVIQMIVDSHDDPEQIDEAWKSVTDKSAPKPATKPAPKTAPKPAEKPASQATKPQDKPAETKSEAPKAEAKPATAKPIPNTEANRQRFEAIKAKREAEAKAKAEAEAKAKAEAEATAQPKEETVNGVEGEAIDAANAMDDETFMAQFGG